MSPLEVVESYLRDQQIPFDRAGDRITFALQGEHKHRIPIVIAFRERTLALESFFMRCPMDNAAEVYRLLLARNFRGGSARFAADADGDVYVVAEAPRDGFDAAALDALLGSVHAAADELFDAAVGVGFASYLEKERVWRAQQVRAESERSPIGEISETRREPPTA